MLRKDDSYPSRSRAEYRKRGLTCDLCGDLCIQRIMGYNYNSWFNNAEYPDNLKLLLKAKEKFSKITFYGFPLEKIEKTFQLFAQRKTRRMLFKS